MIAVDTNVLVDAHRRESALHREARAVVGRLAGGGDLWAIPWPCCFEFLSVMTNRRVWGASALSPDAAWRQLAALFASPANRRLGETGDFLEIVEGFVRRPRVRGAMVHDARVAAICLAHGVEVLLTRDRDFSNFPELRTENPFPRRPGG